MHHCSLYWEQWIRIKSKRKELNALFKFKIMIQLKDKNALITGSSRGIGQQIAQGLAKLGCNIVVHGRTKESCKKTLSLLEKYNVNVYCVFGELSDESQVNQLINQVQNLKIRIDILYNNAARFLRLGPTNPEP